MALLFSIIGDYDCYVDMGQFMVLGDAAFRIDIFGAGIGCHLISASMVLTCKSLNILLRIALLRLIIL